MTGTASPDGSAGVDPGAVQTEAQKLQTMMEDHELNFQSFQQRLAITYTLQAMQQVAQAMAGFPGRKSLIWASGGFPFSVSDNTMQLAPAGRDSLTDVLPMYEHTWQLLNDAQIALYPVDVKGLQVVGVPTASVSNPGRNYTRNMYWRNLDTQATLQTFASMTGGRAYYNSNDLVKGFRNAVSDSSEYYMLGYYLDRSKTKVRLAQTGGESEARSCGNTRAQRLLCDQCHHRSREQPQQRHCVGFGVAFGFQLPSADGALEQNRTWKRAGQETREL